MKNFAEMKKQSVCKLDCLHKRSKALTFFLTLRCWFHICHMHISPHFMFFICFVGNPRYVIMIICNDVIFFWLFKTNFIKYFHAINVIQITRCTVQNISCSWVVINFILDSFHKQKQCIRVNCKF